MSIPNELIEKIKNQADIVQVISSYINVINKGNSYVAICPFHNDKNPSLQISKSKQIYKCFSCGKSGNVFTFVSDYEHIPFAASVKKVASMVNISDPSLDDTYKKTDSKNEAIYKTLNAANEIYTYSLKSKDGILGKEYLEKRNIDEEMQDYFSLGFSSSNAELPIKLLRGKGFSVEDIDNAGILVRKNGLFTDRFTNRVMFPIFNEFDEVCGFSARKILDNDEAKYVNSPATKVFNKSNILYNYQNAIKEARNEDKVYVTEGFMDVFALYKAGIRCSVALMGTAFTKYHAKMLKKLGVQIVLCLDGDEAGQHGMIKAGEVLSSNNIDYSVVNYKDCVLDPDEILQKYGIDVLKKFLTSRIIDKNTFIINYYLKKNDIKTIEGKTNFINSVIPSISNIENPVEKEIIIKQISDITGLTTETLEKYVGKKETLNKDNYHLLEDNNLNNKKKTHLENLEKECFIRIINYQEALNDFQNHGSNYFLNDLYEKIVSYAIDLNQKGQNFDVSSLINVLSQSNDPRAQEMIDLITTESINKNMKSYKQDEMFDILDNLREEITQKNEKDKFINNINGKSYKEASIELQKFIDRRKGGK